MINSDFGERRMSIGIRRLCQWRDTRAQKASSTLRTSQAVPHPSTDRAFGCLTSEFRWDRVYSTEYGRWRKGTATIWSPSGAQQVRSERRARLFACVCECVVLKSWRRARLPQSRPRPRALTARRCTKGTLRIRGGAPKR